MEKLQKRQIAYKVRIGDLNKGEYVKESGWLPNYILLNAKKISRINILGVVVAVQEGGKEFMVEDRSGRIIIRSFEEKDYGVNVGDIIKIIGRPREFNNERYVVPEIVRITNRDWLRLRELELSIKEGINVQNRGEEKKEKKVKEEIIKSSIDPEEVMKQIKLLDDGDGADYEELLEKIKDEKIIKMLLEEGEIFEMRPGKIKIL
jgi:RPA family protein